MNDYSPCPACRRHVRTVDRRCPFCSTPFRLSALAAVAAAGLALSGCVPAAVYGPPPAPAYGPPPRTRTCEDTPQIVILDWTAEERADVEVVMRQGAVVLHRDGCDVKVLAGCTAPGTYGWSGAEPLKNEKVVHGLDELASLMPRHGQRFESAVQTKDGLKLSVASPGRHTLTQVPSRSALQGQCDRATHVVTAVRAGAFEIASGADVLVSDGVLSACSGADPKASSPPERCGALLKLEVERLR